MRIRIVCVVGCYWHQRFVDGFHNEQVQTRDVVVVIRLVNILGAILFKKTKHMELVKTVKS